MTPQKLIIDTDPGQDDAVAILLALASPEIDLLGITTVAGNVPRPDRSECPKDLILPDDRTCLSLPARIAP